MMEINPTLWKALVQGFHSALIDELNARLPAVKPELGLPVKSLTWMAPRGVGSGTRGIAGEVFFDEAPGCLFRVYLLMAPGCMDVLRLDLAAFWEAWVQLAEDTFGRWNHPIRLGPARDFCFPEVPESASQISRLVWIPLAVSGCGCWIGFAA